MYYAVSVHFTSYSTSNPQSFPLLIAGTPLINHLEGRSPFSNQSKNRKDIQIREQQFFDWLLKGERPSRWLIEGVPAINKGKDWGLEVE